MNDDQCRRIVRARAGSGDPAMARCERCGLSGPLTAHHRVKRSHGGAWSPSNIVLLCGSGTTGCHGWAEAKPTDAQAAGWSVPSGTDPATVPVVHVMLGGIRVLLADDGTLTITHHQETP